MWEYEHSVWTGAAPEAVWRRWSDMATGPEWNHGIEAIGVEGPSEGGTRIVYRTEIVGDVPDGLGPAITADFPEVLAKLAAIS